MSDSDMINVEIAYALPGRQQILALKVAEGCSVFDAAQQSDICKLFPEIELESAKLGLFGKTVAKPKQQALVEGDRVEIYRPLIADPKEARKQRAAKVKAAKVSKS